MKQFEMTAFGLEELTASEMQVEGGGFLRDYILGKVIDWTIGAIIDGFKDGTYSDWYSTMYANNPYYTPLR